MERASEGEPNWVWLGGESPRSHPSPEDAFSYGGFVEGGRPTLGNVELRGGEVVLSANSAGRAERGQELLVQILGDLAGAPSTSFQTPEEALEQRPRERPKAPDLDPEEAARLMRAYLDGHYRKVLSEPVPALDGQTPREAARSEAGREKVAGWLKHLENHEIRRARGQRQTPYDFGWMWEELGLGTYRR